MARCYCRWRNVLLCVCTPCIGLAMLVSYIMVVLCLRSVDLQWEAGITNTNKDHFVAPGTWAGNNTFSPVPKTFWKDSLHGEAFWNRLQLAIDRHFNPNFHTKKNLKDFENTTYHDILLRDSFSEVLESKSSKTSFDELPDNMKWFVNHMQKRDYDPLIHTGQLCGAGLEDQSEPPLLLFAIKTTMLNFKNRQVIRQTWGRDGWVKGHNSSGGYVRRVFLLGKENMEKELGTELLELESIHYKDILLWDFMDTFFNLTLKDVLFWKWFSRRCNRAVFVFKGDDDVFVNTPRLLTYLQTQVRESPGNLNQFMAGDVIGSAAPDRHNKSKYFIPDTFYRGLYPMYAGGGGVVYSGLLTRRLYKVSKAIHLFPIDDVYVGMCMLRLNASPVLNPAFLTFGFKDKEEELSCAYHRILLVHKRSPEQIVKLWDELNNTQRKCFNVPLRDGLKKVKGGKR